MPLRTCQLKFMGGGGGAMVTLEKNYLPSILTKKTLPSSTINKNVPPPPPRPIFRSISLVDTNKNPLRGNLKFHIEPDIKNEITQYADIPGILL